MVNNAINILGVKVDGLDHDEIIEKVESFLADDKFHQIATVGPEFILEAQKNKEFKDILNNCDLNVADGIGIKFAFWRFGKKLKYRMAGADLLYKILKVAENRRLGVFLICRKNGLSNFEEIKAAILKIYPELEINGKNLKINNSYKLQTTNYKLILCNFGAPHQEIFLNSLKNDLPLHLSRDNKYAPLDGQNNSELNNNELRKERCRGIIGVAMGVGGSFDFITGNVKRAPIFMRKYGLEWLWRLIQQPKRFKRIWNAVIIFPIKVIFNKNE